MLFRVLGALEVEGKDGERVVITGRKQRSLLIALLLHANTWVSRQRLIGLLWSSDPPRSAAANLKTYIWELRRVLPKPVDRPDRIEAGRGEYRLWADPAELDLLAFEEAVDGAAGAEAKGDHAVAIDLLSWAVGLWRDGFGDDFGEALAGERTRWEEARATAQEDLCAVRLRSGQHVEVVAELRGLIASQPLRERLWEHLMLALYRSGRRAEALAAYRNLYDLLDRELGMTPGPPAQQLHEQILRDDPTLKPARTVVPGPAAQLPPDLASFTGRTEELDQLLGGVRRTPTSGARAAILAIDGMAGAGKTTLAVHAAHLLLDLFPDGQLFLDMHGFTDGVEPVGAGDALDRLLRTLGVPGEAMPQHLADRSAMFRSELAGRRMLILLDNVAAESQVLPLVPAAPGCLMLITGRRRLTGLDDAVQLSLDVLPMTDAVELFARVAGEQRARCEPDSIAEVVRLCGQLPLAIRIAAARLSARPTWTVAHLAGRLRDRQRVLSELATGERSVAATLRVSYDHLTGEQKRLFRLAGLNPGSDLDVEAAAALVDIDPDRAYRLLEALVDAHLMTQTAADRYSFHDLIRQQASELAAAEEPAPGQRAAIRRLLDHWVLVASAAAEKIFPENRRAGTPAPTDPGVVRRFGDAMDALDWMAAERLNLLGAIAYTAQHGPDRHTCRLAGALHAFFFRHGYIDDWIVTEEVALAAARRLGDHGLMAKSLSHLSAAHARLGQGGDALRCLELALEVHRDRGDRRLEAYTLASSGFIAFGLGRYTEALELQRRAWELFGAIEAQTGDAAEEKARTLHLLGLILWRTGRYSEALRHMETVLPLYVERDKPNGQADTLNIAGLVRTRMGRYAEALADARRALACYQRSADSLGQVYALNLVGLVLCNIGEFEAALDHLTHARSLIQRAGARASEAFTLNVIGSAERGLGDLPRALDLQRQALAITRETGDQGLECEVLNNIGGTFAAGEQWSESLESHQHALKLADVVGDPYENALAHAGIAAALRSLGDPESAAPHADRASADFRALDVPHP